MPLYRYECKICGHEFRVLQQRDDQNTVTCPSCEGKELHRLPSRVSIQFKGSGYYKTDRANKKSKAGTKGLNEKEKSSEGSSGTSKDSHSNDSGDSKSSKDSGDAKSEKSDKSSKNG